MHRGTLLILHKGHFTCYEELYSASDNSWKMSSVALEELVVWVISARA